MKTSMLRFALRAQRSLRKRVGCAEHREPQHRGVAARFLGNDRHDPRNAAVSCDGICSEHSLFGVLCGMSTPALRFALRARRNLREIGSKRWH